MSTLEEGPSKLQRFIAEMRRRHVVRFTVWYWAATFAVLQLAEIVFDAFGVGEVWLRILVIGVVLAFPPLVVLTWIFDVTSEGIKRTEDLPPDRRIGSLLPRLTLLGVTFVLVGGLALWLAGAMGSRELAETGKSTVEATASGVRADHAIRSLAVLPLDNFSADTAQNYFTDGMHEALISELSQVPGIRVVSRTSVMQYAGTTKPIPTIAKELGVDAILEGSVQKAGDEVRISVQLVNAANDSNVWSGRYDRKLEDILSLQSDVAHQIVRAIQGEINPEDAAVLRHASRRRVAPSAQEDYLRGKYAYERGTPQGYRTALERFREAVRADSSFAPAYAGLAGSRFLLGMQGPVPDTTALREAQAEAERAVALDSESVEAREVLSFIRKGMQAMAAGDDTGPPPPIPGPKGTRMKRVIHMPGIGDSVIVDVQPFDTAWVGALTQLGQGIADRIRRSAPGNRHSATAIQLGTAWQLMSTGQFEPAVTLLQHVVASSPDNPIAWETLVRAEVSTGHTDGVVSAVASWSKSGAPGAPKAASAADLGSAMARDGMRGYWSWELKRLQEREGSGHDVPRVYLAAAHAGLGENDKALALLSQAFARGERGLLSLQFDPVWDGLRNDPRFLELAREARELRYAPAMRGSHYDRGRRR